MRVVIIGAGKMGLFLASHLYQKHDVVLHRAARRSRRRRALDAPRPRHDRGRRVRAGGSRPAHVEDADLLIAATGDDEDNLVVSMLAKIYRVKTVFARVNYPGNEWLFTKEWGVDIPVSSSQIMYGLVEKQVGLGDLITLLKLQADNTSIQEVTLPADSPAVGKRLADLNLPSKAQVMAIIGASGVTVARGDTVLQAGDQLLLLSDGSCGPEVCDVLGVAMASVGTTLRGATAFSACAAALPSVPTSARRSASATSHTRTDVPQPFGRDRLGPPVVVAEVERHVGEDHPGLHEQRRLDPERRLVVEHVVGGRLAARTPAGRP